MRSYWAETFADLAGVAEAGLAVHIDGPLWYRTNAASDWCAETDPPYASYPLTAGECREYTASDGRIWLGIALGEPQDPPCSVLLAGFRPEDAQTRDRWRAILAARGSHRKDRPSEPFSIAGVEDWLTSLHPGLPPVRCLLDASGTVARGIGYGRDWSGRRILPEMRAGNEPRLRVAFEGGDDCPGPCWAEIVPYPSEEGRWLLTSCRPDGRRQPGSTRRALALSLESRIREASRTGGLVPLVVIDLDQFAHINEWLGWDAGDGLLAEVEDRLSAVAGREACARLGGDEFACVLPACASQGQALEAARDLLRVLSRPLASRGEAACLTASAGISIYPHHGACFESLLLSACQALRRAKRRGKNRLETAGHRQAVSRGEKGRLASRLRNRIAPAEFRFRYQPQVTLEGTLAGFEALAEWLHPELGLIPPDRFIPVAEECGRINELGSVLLSIAALQVSQWRQRLGFAGRLGVNISALQFDRPDFAGAVADVLRRVGVPGESLELEITETRLISDIAAARHACARLRALGVSICLDDFGVGFASLRMLQDLPLDSLKLDQSFVRDLGNAPEGSTLVESIVGLVRREGLRLVAEGVERPEELRRLIQAGCDAVQGYLLSPPLDAETATRLLAEHRSWGNLLAGRGQAAGT